MRTSVLIFFFLFVVIALAEIFHGDSMLTPFGYLPKECVHMIDSGSTVHETENYKTVISPNGEKKFIKPCPYNLAEIIIKQKLKSGIPTQYDGWLAYTCFATPDNSTFDSFLGYFSVPSNPENTPEELYIFTGLQNSAWTPDNAQPADIDIIQPVLQYPAESGFGWSIRSWYVTFDGAMYSTELTTSSGDQIYGNMTKTGQTEWYIGTTSSNSGQTTSLKVNKQRLISQAFAFNTIECYGCQDCSYLPTDTCQFSKLALIYQNTRPISPSWDPRVNTNPICAGTRPKIIDSTTVSFIFQ